MEKRGLSTVVSSVLIILIAIIAVSAVFVILKNNFFGSLGDGGSEGGIGNQVVECLDAIFQVNSCGVSDSTLLVSVNRKAGDQAVKGIRFVFTTNGKSEIIDRFEGIPKELETSIFEFTEDFALSTDSIDVAAILDTGEVCNPSGLPQTCDGVMSGDNGTEDGSLNIFLSYTGDEPRIGHPIEFRFEEGYTSIQFKLDGETYPKPDGNKFFYTPLRTGVHTFDVTAINDSQTLNNTVQINVVLQDTDYLKVMEQSNMPMISLWNESIGIGFDELADYHMCRMVFSGRPNKFGNDRYFDWYAEDATTTMLSDAVLQDLYDSYDSGQDVCLFFFRFPHPWQFNPSDYNSSSQSNYDSSNSFEINNWESPFAIEGPSEVTGWVDRVLNQIDNGNGKPSGFKIDQVILDWESHGGRHFIGFNDGWECKYQWFNIYSPSVCSFDNNTQDGSDDAFNVPVMIEEATNNDPRFAQAKIERGVTFDSTAWDNNANYEKRYNITRVLYGEWDRMVRDIFFIPLKNHYSDVIFTQYNYAIYPKDDPFKNNRDQQLPPSVEPDASNAFSPALYFCNDQNNPKSVNEIMALEINSVKIMQRNNYLGTHFIIPWVKPANAIRYQDCPGTNINLPEINDQQIWEAHLHFLMSGAESFIAWNAGDNEAFKVESMNPLQNAFATFVNLVPENSIPIETESLTANDDYWISARRAPDQTKYVLVSFLKVDSVTYEGVTLKKPDGETFGIYVI